MGVARLGVTVASTLTSGRGVGGRVSVACGESVVLNCWDSVGVGVRVVVRGLHPTNTTAATATPTRGAMIIL